MADKQFKRLRLTRSIILAGEHAEEGSIHDVPHALAHRLVGEGSAEHHLEEGEEQEAGPTSVNRIVQPTNREPESRRVSGPPAKVKAADKEKDAK
jgi:hypothetical protein